MEDRNPLAHVCPDGQGGWRKHWLDEHLVAVAELAAEFAAAFGSAAWAQLAGRWHDLGKYQPEFQDYIRGASGFDAHIETAPGRVRHAIAGAIHAVDRLGPNGRLFAYLIAGHHAGLPDWFPGAGAALSQELEAQKATLARALAAGIPAGILEPGNPLPRPPIGAAADIHFWLRMLFSCLVDADFLDTEAFMDAGRAGLRGGYAEIPALLQAYENHMAERFGSAATDVQRLRAEIRGACIARAAEPPGLFSLTVPTGGGKTLASLGFALHHARRHGLRRVIYVIPYTSIIEQTADVFRQVFAGFEPMPVIEHHSNLDADTRDAPQPPGQRKLGRARSWSPPTSSSSSPSYAAKPPRCRKLHNIAEQRRHPGRSAVAAAGTSRCRFSTDCGN